MANYNKISELYFQGKTFEQIKEATGYHNHIITDAIQIISRNARTTVDNRLEQVKSIECELFKRIELEQLTGKKDKSIDSLKHAYSTYLIN
jgi:hypothetical protein